MRPHYFSRDPRLRRVQLDLLLMEVFGARYLPDEVAARIRARAEHEGAFMGGIHRAMLRREMAQTRFRVPTLAGR